VDDSGQGSELFMEMFHNMGVADPSASHVVSRRIKMAMGLVGIFCAMVLRFVC